MPAEPSVRNSKQRSSVRGSPYLEQILAIWSVERHFAWSALFTQIMSFLIGWVEKVSTFIAQYFFVLCVPHQLLDLPNLWPNCPIQYSLVSYEMILLFRKWFYTRNFTNDFNWQFLRGFSEIMFSPVCVTSGRTISKIWWAFPLNRADLEKQIVAPTQSV